MGLVFSCQNKYEKAVNFYVNATSLLIGLGALIVHRRANHVLQKKVVSYRQQVCLLNIIWLFDLIQNMAIYRFGGFMFEFAPLC